MVRDFLGVEIKAGSWVAKYGGGNTTCNYGMILYKVIRIDEKGMRVVRLRASYHNRKPEIRLSESTLKKPTACVVVHPCNEAISWFSMAMAHQLDDDQQAHVAKWLHGSVSII